MHRIFVVILSSLMMLAVACPGFGQSSQKSAATGGRVTGAPRQIVDTYAINLSSAQGVRPRDIVQISRGDRDIARAIVIYAGPEYSLVVVDGLATTTVKIGDNVAWRGHMELPPYQPERPRGETVIVRERDVMSSRSASTPSFSMPTFGTPTFGSQGFSNPSFGAPSFGTPGFSNPSFGTPGFANPSFSTSSFGTQGFGQPSFSVPGF